MRTVGQILKEAREAKLYSLEEVEKHTKIRKELLRALEADDYPKLPPSTFVQGFIKNYGKFLNLDTDNLLAVFRRGFSSKKYPPVVMESFANPLGKKLFNLTPAGLLGIIIALIVLGFFTYLWIEYRQFVGSPTLIINSPQDQQAVEVPSVLIDGKTDPEVKVEVNNQQIGVDSEGNFHQEIKLSSSVNKVIITATGKFGKVATAEKTVILKK